jgi:MSHA pilin protein MshD
MCKMSRNKMLRQQGVTIIELVIFIVIVGIAAAALVQALNLASRNSTDPVRRKQAMLIAEAYMEEVQQAQFTVCNPADAHAATATIADFDANDPSKCATQANVEDFGTGAAKGRPFDNINDYVPQHYTPGTAIRAFAVADQSGNLVDTDVALNPLGASSVGGQLGRSGLEGITTTLALDPVTTLGDLNSANNPANMRVLHITITTTYGPGQSIVLDGYRTRYAPEAR